MTRPSNPRKITRVMLEVLGADATVTEVRRFFDAAKEYAGVELRHGIHKIADWKNPRPMPQFDEPEAPDRDDDGYQTPDMSDVSVDEEDKARVRRLIDQKYADARKEYVVDKARYVKKLDELEQDTVKFFMHIMSYLSEEARRKITDRVPDCCDNECPKELLDAIRLTYLGARTGAAGNRITLAMQREHLEQLRQKDMSNAAFFELHANEVQVLKKQEIDAGASKEDMEIIWSEKRQIDHLIFRLDPVRFGVWKDNMRFDKNHPTPKTLEETYREAVIRQEEHRLKVERESGAARVDRTHTYIAKQVPAKRGNGSRRVSGSGQLRELRDAKGNAICFDHNSPNGKCSYGDNCKFSHHPPVIPKGKTKVDVNAMLDKARRVAFADEDSAAGGGPDPAKWIEPKKN